MRFIRKYGPRRRRWDCGSQKLDSIVYLWHGNMEIMPAASYVRFPGYQNTEIKDLSIREMNLSGEKSEELL